jgi:hypothetical protein
MGSLIRIGGLRPSKFGPKCKWATEKQRARFEVLKIFEEAGEIGNLLIFSKCQLSINGISIGNLEAQFEYTDRSTGKWVVEFIKQKEDPQVLSLKKKIFKALYREVELREIHI